MRLHCFVRVFVPLVILTVPAPWACAATVRVAPWGNDANDGSTWALAKASIAQAVSAAGDHGEVWVAAGEYRIWTTSIGKDMRLYGGFAGWESSASERAAWHNRTILRGGLSLSGFTPWGCVDGFTITASAGMGISCEGSPTISGNTITANAENGIHCSSGTPVIANNLILGNGKGGIVCNAAAAPLIANNTVTGSGNPFGYYAGISVRGADAGHAVVANNIVAYNAGGIRIMDDAAVVVNNCVYGNPFYDEAPDAPSFLGKNGNFSSDPAFADRLALDCHITAESPCRGAADLTRIAEGWQDMDGENVPRQASADIGADQFSTVPVAATARVVRVSPDGDDSADGSTWQHAKRTIQSAITALNGLQGQVWVGQGVYHEQIDVPAQVRLMGGFVGTETEAGQRDPGANESVLDADYVGTAVTGSGLGYMTSTIEGLTVRRGTTGIRLSSGSLAVIGNHITQNNVRGLSTNVMGYIAGNHIEDNGDPDAYSSAGGGVQIQGPAVVADNVFRNNHAWSGSALDYHDVYSAAMPGAGPAVIKGNIFEGNAVEPTDSPFTITIKLDGYAVLTGNRITHNYVRDKAAVYCSRSGSVMQQAIVANNEIAANSMSEECPGYGGGGKGIWLAPGVAVNNTIVGNSGAAIEADAESVVSNNIIAFNGRTYDGSPTLVSNCFFGNGEGPVPTTSGNFAADPLFVKSEYGDFRLRPSSPCRNAGTNENALAGYPDFLGAPRIQEERVEIGATECDGGGEPVVSTNVVRVRPDGSDTADGTSWERAKKTVQAAADAAGTTGGEIWVAAGTYRENVNTPPYVSLYGGFAGTEQHLGERNWHLNTTVLDGRGQGTVLTTGAGWAVVDGFTIRNGHYHLDDPVGSGIGGGLVATGSATIANCIVEGNTSEAAGGGIAALGPRTWVTNTLAARNTHTGTSSGGGIYVHGGESWLTNNTCVDNTPNGVVARGVSQLNGNLVAFNGSGVIAFSAWGGDEPARYHANCVFGNTVKDYTFDQTGTNGNISADPQFVDRAGGNYRPGLRSPCLNTGRPDAPFLPDRDLDGKPRVTFGKPDIGAYEVSPEPDEIGDVRAMPSGVAAYLEDVVVTGVLSVVLFYVESPDRSSGICVLQNAHTALLGDRVSMLGLTGTASGERFITPYWIGKTGQGSVEPLHTPLWALGGADWLYDPVKGTGQKGVKQGRGLNNIGLLVRIAGRVTHVDPSGRFCVVWDGSPVMDSAGRTGVKVAGLTGITMPPLGAFVTATGISSCERSGADLYAVLRLRSQSDVAVDPE